MSRTIQFVATDPETGANYTPKYREFFARLRRTRLRRARLRRARLRRARLRRARLRRARLRRARLDRGLSLFEVAELVGLQLPLAYEFENLIVPLPFKWLEVWCKVVGVPFADYLVVYWASEEADFEAQEREAELTETAQSAPCITNTETDTSDTKAPAPELSHSRRGFGFLAPCVL